MGTSYMGESDYILLQKEEASLLLKPIQSVFSKKNPLVFEISCQIHCCDLELLNIFLKVKALEEVSVHKVATQLNSLQVLESTHEDVRSSHQTFWTQVQVCGPQRLRAGKLYKWQSEISIPPNLNPTYRGYNASHEWSVMLSLSAEKFASGTRITETNWMNIEIVD